MTLKQQQIEELKGLIDNPEKYTSDQLALILKGIAVGKKDLEKEIKATAEDAFKTGKARVIEITRSYDRKVQLKQYEPVGVFQSLKAEVYDMDVIPYVSHRLHKHCKAEVDTTINNLLATKNNPQDKPF